MLVDPDILRSFADQVAISANAIREEDAGRKASSAADGLDGSTTQWAVRLVGAHIATLTESIATNVNEMGIAVRGAGDRYEVSDASLASGFTGIF